MRFNSLWALYEIAERDNFYLKDFELATCQIKKENIPSLNVRIKSLPVRYEISGPKKLRIIVYDFSINNFPWTQG
ncbi:MAG: hypothetical protein ACRDE5_15750 [Ginsengibacter sp.]